MNKLMAGLTALLLINSFFAPAHSEGSDELSGIWKAGLHIGKEVGGTLMIRKVGDLWYGDIAGYRTEARPKNAKLVLDFGEKVGQFHGRISRRGKDLEGHWIQPEGKVRFYTKYAMPVRLIRDHGIWRGEIRPLEDRTTLYLVVREGKEGDEQISLVNHESNYGRFFKLSDLEIASNDRATIRGRMRWEKEDHQLITGIFDREQQVLSLKIPIFDLTFDFHRYDETDLVYAPWSRAKGEYRYRMPEQLNDGWDVADIHKSGLDPKPVEEMVKRIMSTPIVDPQDPSIHALLIAHKGTLVFEEYFHGFHRDTLHDTRSASKSLTGSLVGLAMTAGVPISLESRLYDTLSEYQDFAAKDPGKQAITLEDVITMSTGLDCNDWDNNSPGGEDRMQEQSGEPDWYRYILDLNLINEHGSVAAYCSGGMSLAGGMLSAASGKTGAQVIEDYFAKPLEIDTYMVNLMPTGQSYMGGGLRIRARDFMKLGQVMMNGGTWNGKRIMAREFSETAVSPQKELGKMHYGYGWWRKTYVVDGVDYSVFFAGGNGGQYIIGVPDLDLLIVMYGGAYSTRGTFAGREDFLPNYLIPAAAVNN